ncbi:MAG: hypothetical protein OXN27_09545 [Candidatus Poribacteria bacterium]|nr:hypothetical protein [Candidatus Poribacteria bacterium]
MSPDKKAYLTIMEEIVFRTDVIEELISQKINMKYTGIQIESMALQVRMITELIALGSLAANKPLFEENLKKFKKLYHPKEVLRDIEKLNPKFYPEPIVEIQAQDDSQIGEFVSLKSGFMTPDELIEVHGRCGDMLHAKNPYGKGIDYSDYNRYEAIVINWVTRIKTLLNFHLIRPLDQNQIYKVWMLDKETRRPRMQTFQKI